VVVKVTERLMISKWSMQKLYIERFNLKKLFKVESKEEYEFKTSNNFAAMENLYVDVDISRVWETNKEYKNFSQENLSLQTEAV
jgi:hypothetical protein